MSKISSFFLNQFHKNPKPYFKHYCTSISNQDQNLSIITQQIYDVIKKQPRWEKTLISQFPSFNFSNPNFFNEVIKLESNVFINFKLFNWLKSNFEFCPDQITCNSLFNSLVNAKCYVNAKLFIDNAPQFNPKANSGLLECLLCKLFDGGFFDDGLDLLAKFKSFEIIPSLVSWNLILSKAIRGSRTDVFWKLYGEMMECGVIADVETTGFLIEAFVVDGNVMSGYDVLKQVRDGGVIPSNVALNLLIKALAKDGDFDRVSEILHMMIGMNQNPDVDTYHGIVYGLCKRGRVVEAYRVFDSVKERGYVVYTGMYTTMIQGLCRIKWMEKARALWSEMGEKGVFRDEFTYNVFIHGYYRNNDVDEARELVKEMCDKGYKMNKFSYYTFIGGLCMNGKMKEACEVFEEMNQNGVACDVNTYNNLIQGFCSQGDFDNGLRYFKELVASGLRPSTLSYTPLIDLLCRVGRTEEALEFWTEILNNGVEPSTFIRECIINGLCKEGSAIDGLKWFSEMLELKLVPHKDVFETVIQCLFDHNMSEDALAVLQSMLSLGFKLDQSLSLSLISKLCSTSSSSMELHFQDVIAKCQVS